MAEREFNNCTHGNNFMLMGAALHEKKINVTEGY